MKYFSETLFLIALLFAIVITLGTPDLLDGWIKRANHTECVEAR